MVIHLKRKLVSILTKCSKQIEIQLRNIDRQFDNSFVICLPQLIRQFSKIFVFLSNLLKVFATKISSRKLPAFVSQRVTNVSTTTLGRVHGLVNILFQYQTCRCQSKSISQGSGHLVLKFTKSAFAQSVLPKFFQCAPSLGVIHQTKGPDSPEVNELKGCQIYR